MDITILLAVIASIIGVMCYGLITIEDRVTRKILAIGVLALIAIGYSCVNTQHDYNMQKYAECVSAAYADNVCDSLIK